MYARIALIVAFLVSSAHSQCLTDNDDIPFNKDEIDTSPFISFSLDLAKELFPPNSMENFFFSPYSIWNSLSLAYMGSQNNTMHQLEKTLGFQDKALALKTLRYFSFIDDTRNQRKPGNTFRVANKAYFDRAITLRNCMAEALEYEVEKLDFTKADEATATINNFVANVTKNRIPELVQPDDVLGARMLLANAAFFKGTWLTQFKPSATKKKPFYIDTNHTTFVEMMSVKGQFRTGPSEELGAHILQLPYNGGNGSSEISMYIILPPFLSGPNGFVNMVNRLNVTTFQNAILDTWRSEVEIELPKFKLDFTIGNELIAALERMGVTDLFDRANADLSAFTPEHNLSAGKVIHRAFVEVNEEGTEAAAATALISFRSSRPVGPLRFKCNHPFMFILYDDVEENILFMGAYKNPKA